MSDAQRKVLRKALPGYQPERQELRTVRSLKRWGLLRRAPDPIGKTYIPECVETTEAGRVELGMKPRHARPLLRVYRGGNSS